MMMSHQKFAPSCFLLVLLSTAIAQDGLTFEETIEDQSKLPSDKRVPVENKLKCGENELYYPGDQDSDWICDCRPSYLYYPADEKCHPAYEQGPCNPGQYLILPDDGYTPECVRNPCNQNKFVPYGRNCVRLGNPCFKKDTRRRFGVDEITLRIGCLPIPENQRSTTTPSSVIKSRFDEDVPANKYCFKGCKRHQNKECVLGVK